MHHSQFLRALTLGTALGFLVAANLTATPAHAGASILVEADSGKVLRAENATYPWYPASVTKLMTMYVTLQAVKQGRVTFDTLFTVSRNALAQSPTKMGFPVGTQVTVDNALKMMMVKSANDMAVLLAEGVDGSIENFADDMTRTAHRLGMSESNFVNPNGLPADGQITSARDLAILARALIHDFPEYNFYWHIPAIKWGRRVVRNYNTLLGRYPGADGMKTGFICASGFNLVATATRNGRQLIAVVLGSPSGAARAVKAAELLESGFTQNPLGWLTPALGTVDALTPINADPPNLHEASLRAASQAAGRRGRRCGRWQQVGKRRWREHAVLRAAFELARPDTQRRCAPVRLRCDNADRGLYRADAIGFRDRPPQRHRSRRPSQQEERRKTAAAKPVDEKATDAKRRRDGAGTARRPAARPIASAWTPTSSSALATSPPATRDEAGCRRAKEKAAQGRQGGRSQACAGAVRQRRPDSKFWQLSAPI